MLSVKIDYGTGHVCILCQFSISTIGYQTRHFPLYISTVFLVLLNNEQI